MPIELWVAEDKREWMQVENPSIQDLPFTVSVAQTCTFTWG